MTSAAPRVRALAVLCFGIALSQSVEAHAHLGHLVLRAERYVKIDVAPGEVRVVVSLMLGPTETRRALEPADTNHDDAVSRAEADAYLAGWAAELQREMVLTIDGAPAADVVWRDGVLEPIGPIAAQPLTVEMIAHVPLSGGEHTFRLRDAMDLSRLERTDVAFHARDGATIVRSGIGAEPREREDELSFGPEFAPSAGRIFTAVLQTPEDPTSPALMIAAVVGAVLLLLVGVIVMIKRK